jgi:hypothetical protein
LPIPRRSAFIHIIFRESCGNGEKWGEIFNILSSIYKDAGLFDLAINWCLKSLEYDKDNYISYLQLAVIFLFK